MRTARWLDIDPSKQFKDEITPELRFVGAGVLAMANSGPNTNGSQFVSAIAARRRLAIHISEQRTAP